MENTLKSETINKVLVSTIVTLGIGAAPIIPSEMELAYSYQYDTTQIVSEERAIATTSVEKVSQPKTETFSDADGNGVISVSVFTDRKGNVVETQIPDAKYQSMGERGGAKNNPTKTELTSVLDRVIPTTKAAVTRDTKSLTYNGTAASSVTFSHDGGSGTDRLTAVVIQAIDLNKLVSSVTYNGTNLTKIDEVQRGGQARYLSQWYLAGSDTGSNNVVVSFSGGNSRSIVGAVTLSGINQTNPLDDWDSFSDASADTTSPFSMTASVAGCWPIGFVVAASAQASTHNPDSNSSEIDEFDIYLLIESATTPLSSSGAVSIGTTHPSSISGGVAGLYCPEDGGGGATRRVINVTQF